MLVDSEPNEECYHSLIWVMAGKANQMEGGVKWVSSPVLDGESKAYHSNTKCSYLLRGTHTDYGGMVLYPPNQPSKEMTANYKSRARGCAPSKKGGYIQCVDINPLKNLPFDYQHR